MVTKMANGEKQVPLDHCPFIQDFTGGVVTCEELRPDQVEYFSRIRAQGKAESPSAIIDRRDPTRPNPYTGTDIDRRAPAAAREG